MPEPPAEDRSMKITDALPKALIIPEIRATRKLDVIGELAARIAEHQAGMDPEEILRCLREREEAGSTAINEGLAIPHGKVGSISQPVACLGRSRKGVAFGSADGKPTHIFFAVVSPVHSSGEHLKLLARFGQLFRGADFRARLVAARTADDIHRIIVEEDAR